MVGLIIRLVLVAAVLWFVGVPLYKLIKRVWGGDSGRVWLAREGIVEESKDAVVLFPWNKVNSFDKTELGGRDAIRIWLNEDPDLQFRLLNIHLPAEQQKRWISRRIAELRTSQYWTSAQIVLRENNVDEPMEHFFVRLRRLAGDPSAAAELPSVLDDPDPLDLNALGIGKPAPTDEAPPSDDA